MLSRNLFRPLFGWILGKYMLYGCRVCIRITRTPGEIVLQAREHVLRQLLPLSGVELQQ